MLSRELQIGKAAEHYVAFDLIMQGFNAFLADQGLPFDVVVEHSGKLWRVQVKSTSKPIQTGKNHNPHYRFGLRHAKGASRALDASEVDVLALMAMDTKMVAYIPIVDAVSKDTGGIVQAIDMYMKDNLPYGRVYSTGTRRQFWGRCMDDFAKFPESGRGVERQANLFRGSL